MRYIWGMSKTPQPIVVTIKEGRHKTQPWSFVINRPGPQNKETKSERYARLFTAKRGALRMLCAMAYGTTLRGSRFYVVPGDKGKHHTVRFYIIRRTKPKAK